jgi:DNA-binding FadR family transcriptional regulator
LARAAASSAPFAVKPLVIGQYTTIWQCSDDLNTPWQRAANFSPMPRSRLGSRIADHLRRLITAGEMRPGSRLPSLRLLAEMLGVSVPTVREAIAELIAMDFVEIRFGIGTYVSQRPSNERRLLVAEFRRATPRELAEVWATIEPAGAFRAAERMATSPRQLRTFDNVRLMHLEFERAQFDLPETWVDAHGRLHTALVAASAGSRDGRFAARLRASVVRRLRPGFLNAAPELAPDDWLLQRHAELVYAVLGGEADEAARYASLVARHELAALG